MKVIIAGSRSITDYALVEKAINDSGFKITEVVSGHAHGVDTLGEQWAEEHRIPIKIFEADWETYGKLAGYKRNYQMGVYAKALIAVHQNSSPGTRHMIATMHDMNKLSFVYKV